MVGNQSVKVSSREVALAAAREFVGPDAQPIFDRTTGDLVGEAADGKSYRFTSIDKPEPYINLQNATGGNLHVRF